MIFIPTFDFGWLERIIVIGIDVLFACLLVCLSVVLLSMLVV